MNEIIIGILIFSWLLGNAIGSFSYQFISDKHKVNRLLSPIYLFTSNLLLFIFLFIIRWSISAFQYASTPNLIFTVFVACIFILPVSVASGLTFTSFTRNSKTSKIYLLESIAAFIGGLLFTFLLAGQFDSIAISLYLVAIVSFFLFFDKKLEKAALSLILVAVLLLIAYFTAPGIVRISNELAWGKNTTLLSAKNSKFGNIVKVSNGELTTLYYNGKTKAYSLSSLYDEESILPLLVSPQFSNILILGYTPLAILPNFLKVNPKSITIVTIDKELYSGFNNETTEENTKISIKFMDPFRWTKSSQKKYDLIIIRKELPSTMAENRFFTKLFYTSLKHSLTKEGVVYFNIDYEENKIDSTTMNNIRILYNTMEPCFMHVSMLAASKFHFFGSDVKLNLSNQSFLARMRNIKFESDVINSGFIKHYLSDFKTKQINTITTKFKLDTINKHFDMTIYYNNLKKWFKIHVKDSIIYLLGLAAVILILLVKKRKIVSEEFFNKKSSLLLFSMGFTSMAGEILLLNFYQSVTGYVYYMYALLISTYMLGIGFGSIYVLTLKVDRELLRKILPFTIPIWIIFIEVLYLYEPIHFTQLTILSVVIFAFNFIGGMDIGMVFKLEASTMEEKGENDCNIATSLYSFDLLGAAIGALLIPAIMLPTLGHIATSVTVTILALYICFLTARRKA
jgi:predicted membrane-bound spermidine synthase